MKAITRRQVLAALLGGALSAAGTVVLARAQPAAENPVDPSADSSDVLARAEQVVLVLPPPIDPVGFLNRAFRNGGFRNGGFVNGGFRNGGFVNGGFRNGGFRNGAFRNW